MKGVVLVSEIDRANAFVAELALGTLGLPFVHFDIGKSDGDATSFADIVLAVGTCSNTNEAASVRAWADHHGVLALVVTTSEARPNHVSAIAETARAETLVKPYRRDDLLAAAARAIAANCPKT